MVGPAEIPAAPAGGEMGGATGDKTGGEIEKSAVAPAARPSAGRAEKTDSLGPLAGLLPRTVVRRVQAALVQAGCPDADYDARELYRLATGQDSRLCRDPLSARDAEKLERLTARRAGREPLQYLAGRWGFLDFTLAVGPGVLCPRPDTEVVCEAAVACLQPAGDRPAAPVAAPVVLDLCAGTGCLGLGIKRYCPDAQVTCVEKSDAALAYLQENAATALPGFSAARPAVTVRQADVFTLWQALGENTVDLIVSNPPYLTATEMTALMPETAREPALALAGGADGLDFYRLLVANYQRCLRPGGWLVLEIGWQQRAAVEALAQAAGWHPVAARQDYGGNDRVILAQKPLPPV